MDCDKCGNEVKDENFGYGGYQKIYCNNCWEELEERVCDLYIDSFEEVAEELDLPVGLVEHIINKGYSDYENRAKGWSKNG